ncbi:MAG: amino acid adenylation domain-containing protein [Janthinobacterium lividum]
MLMFPAIEPEVIMAESTTLPLSTAQRGMWVGEQLAPPGAIFNVAEAIELDGAIDPVLLRKALLLLTQEVETTRVRLVRGVGLPRQIVMPTYGHPIDLHDFSGETDPRGAARRYMMNELSGRPNFENGPLWFSAVLKLSDRSWYWYHRAHHIVLDGYSGGMIVQRVAELYSALRQGRDPVPAGLSSLRALADFDETYRDSDRYIKDRAYWHAQLADLPDAVTLSHETRPLQGGLLRATTKLPNALVSQLRERLAGTTITLPQALIGLVAIYYQRMSGVSDLVLGMPVTGRFGGIMRRCPGMVANAVPIRLRFAPDDTVATMFAQTARVVRQALRHQQYRYEDLRRDLNRLKHGQQIARIGVNIEPFDFSFDFDGVPLLLDNLCNSQMEDLTIFVYDRHDGGGLRIDLDANPALYSQAELDRHKQLLCRLIALAIQDLDVPIVELDLLGEDDRARILHQWNDTAPVAKADDADVVALFRRQVSATPDAPAVVSEAGCVLGYRELDARSGALAAHLAGTGIGAGKLVAVALPRSELLPVALLAILRAGAAYLPIDPDGAPERLAMILADARPALVLTVERHAARFEALGLQCLLLDRPSSIVTGTAPDAPLDPAATAYVIYTSGSTGRPKGVSVSHANLSNFLLGMVDVLKPGEHDRLLSVTTVTFDIAGLELFLPLVSGGQSVIATSCTVRDPLALGRLIQAQRITLLQATPSLWRSLLANRAAVLDDVHALVGGEALSAELAGRMLGRCAQVTNMYGPTETTVWSTAMRLSADDIEPPPIGRPIRNTRVYVLDERMQPVPEGVTGMLYIGGAGVADGYLNRPERTAESFGPDPFAGNGNPGGRLYRTGDLARWRADGVLVYLGRQDQQVKLRGYRIELGEIETALQRHPAVADAVVAVRSDLRDEPALVAYLVGSSKPGGASDAVLRQHLSRHVPDHMIPSLFMTLDELPLNASGKIDRNALPEPFWANRMVVLPEEPRTQTERQLFVIWQTVLGRQSIGIHDNFFGLGGDSLTAAQMLVEIAETFSVEIPLDSLFRAATIADLARLLDGGRTTGSLDTLLPLSQVGEKPPLFCVHPITGVGWAYAALTSQVDAGRPLYALQAKGLGQQMAPDASYPQTIEEMALSYVEEIRTLQPEGPYHLLGWSLGGLVVHAMAVQLRRDGHEVAFLGLLDSYPFRIGDEADAIDEAAQVRLALQFLGLQQNSQGSGKTMPGTMAELADFLCVEYDLLSQPVMQAIMRTDNGIVARLEQVVGNNLALARRYAPEPVDVDAVFLSASIHTGTGLDSVIEYQPSVWQKLVRNLSIYEVDCHHQEILSAGAVDQVGVVLRTHLQAASAVATSA